MRSYEIHPHWREDGKEIQELVSNDGQEILYRTAVTIMEQAGNGQQRVRGQMLVMIDAINVDDAFEKLEDAVKQAHADWMRQHAGPKLIMPGGPLRMTK